MDKKERILKRLSKVERKVKKIAGRNGEFVSLTNYSHLAEEKEGRTIWTNAINIALRENEFLYIPESNFPYYVDASIIIPSGRCIKAEKNAVICMTENSKVLMFRNENVIDGSHILPQKTKKDKNISIDGGRWETLYRVRASEGGSGRYDEVDSYHGISAVMHFNNVKNLCLKNMTFYYAPCFGIQIGEIKNAVIENIEFENCFSDGVHINGNSENLVVRNIRGYVGDDLVALNMCDWDESSVNFGPLKNVLCENLELSDESPCKSLRIIPGIYQFDNGTSIDCTASNIIVREVSGITAYKMYMQTPAYKIGETPEERRAGNGNNLFFENLNIDLYEPVDKRPEQMCSDSVRGKFGAFEIGSNIKNVYFKNINLKLYKEKFPLSYFASIGPKSSLVGENEIFDPYISSKVENLYYSEIFVNDKKIDDLEPYICCVEFDDINNDGFSTAKGEIKNIIKE